MKPHRREDMSTVKQEENVQESIHKYICSHSSTDPENVKDLCQKWMNLCEELDINLQYVRCKMDSWFMEVYNFRNQLEDVITDPISGRMQTKKDELYWRFFDDFKNIVRNEGVLEKMQMTAAVEKIKSKYSQCSGDWVDLAVQCVSAEFDLMAQRQQCEQIQQANEKIEQDINNASQIHLRINEAIKALNNKVSDLRVLNEGLEENQGHFRDSQAVSSVLPRQNGQVPEQQYFQRQLQQIEEKINSVTEEVKSQHQGVSQMFQELYAILADLVANLESKVKEWQWEFQFDYAELAASADLEKQVAPWCAQTGRIIHDVLHESLVSWQNTLNNLPSDSCESLNDDSNMFEQHFQCMMSQFVKRTFVLTEQGNFFIKTGNKRFPKFVVRVLAADHFSRHSEETAAHFLSEEDLKLCWKKNDLDLNMLKKKERKLRKSKLNFTAEKGRSKIECSFQNLQFENSFKRTQKDQNKQVHEEKYRVVFITKVEETTCWTLSLPLVVTTASNQEAHSLASIMWQCFSTDVFNPASDIPMELPWSKVAEMLQAKMARLSTTHRLTAENITHLKNRLFGEENFPDDTPVSLTEFCWTAMSDTDFSFWKWFLGVYNLIEQFLQQFWHDGLIMGFVKKEDAEKMLEKCDKAGAFILRFSDKHFTNSDGRRSVYGRLTSCVVVMKDAKGNKRNSLGQLEPVKRKVIEHVDVADFKKLGGELKKAEEEECPRNNLANILKETWIKSRDEENRVPMYCCLYPSEKSREELFDKYCKEGTPVPGYKHTQMAFIAILEQTMSKINITKKPEESVGTDMSVQLGNVKKARRSRDNTERVKRSPRGSSSCHSNISTPQGSPFPVQSPITPSQSPGYPAQSPGYPGSSPAQSVPSPALAMHLQRQPSTDFIVSSADNKSQLPTVIGEHFSGSPVSTRPMDSFPEIRRTLGKTSLRSSFQLEQIASIPGRNVMEVASGNIAFIDSATLDATPEERDQTFTHQLFDPKTTMVGGVCPSVIGSHMTVGGTDMAVGEEGMLVEETEFSENPEVLIVVNNGGQLDVTHSNQLQQSAFEKGDPVLNFLSSKLTPDQFQQVQRWLSEEQAVTQSMVQQTPDSGVDAGLSSVPVSTSSGSSGEFFGYSGNQLAAMGSGDIDPNFTLSITGSDTQVFDANS